MSAPHDAPVRWAEQTHFRLRDGETDAHRAEVTFPESQESWSLSQTRSVWPSLGPWATANIGEMTMYSVRAGELPSALVPVLGSRQSLSLDAKTEMGPAVYSTKAFYSFKNQPLGLFCKY